MLFFLSLVGLMKEVYRLLLFVGYFLLDLFYLLLLVIEEEKELLGGDVDGSMESLLVILLELVE